MEFNMYDIVVIGTWRNCSEWEQCLKNAGLRESVKILGATSLLSRGKAEEISDYLSAHPNIESYLIFDDASLFEDNNEDEHHTELDALDVHGNNLVLCYPERGFGEEEYNVAVALHFRQKYRSSKDVSSSFSDSRDLKGLTSAAIELLYAVGELTVSFLQRAFKIGYGRAAEIIDFLVENKIALIKKVNGYIKYLPSMEYEEVKAKLHQKL